MFDSQLSSLASLTFLVMILGLIIAISFRLRSPNSVLNLTGLLIGLGIMGVSSIFCLIADPASGIYQGVAVVAVAIASTLSWRDPVSSGF